jgi:hypothetical protein
LGRSHKRGVLLLLLLLLEKLCGGGENDAELIGLMEKRGEEGRKARYLRGSSASLPLSSTMVEGVVRNLERSDMETWKERFDSTI